MSDVKLYGIAASRAFRSLWAAEEIGLVDMCRAAA